MTINTSRRRFLRGAATLLAAPALVRVASIMPVRVLPASLAPLEYGRSPMMEMLPDIQRLQEAMRQILERTINPPLLQLATGEYRPMGMQGMRWTGIAGLQDPGA